MDHKCVLHMQRTTIRSLYLNTMQYNSKEPQTSASNITNFSINEGNINAGLLH